MGAGAVTARVVTVQRAVAEIFPDEEGACRAGAESFAERAAEAIAERGRFTVALSGGTTPEPMYRFLGEEPLRSRIEWGRVHLLWGDERCVPPAHPRSNFGMAWRVFVSRVPIPGENVHRMRGELPPEEGAAGYARELRALLGGGAPVLDLVHLGLGDDGHTASLFPFSAVPEERGRLVRTALAPDRAEARLTLTETVMNMARRVEFLVLGAEKAEIVRVATRGALDPVRVPAQRVAPASGPPVWYLDTGAGGRLET